MESGLSFIMDITMKAAIEEAVDKNSQAEYRWI